MKGEQVVIVNEADASDDDTEMQDVEAVPERVKSLLLSVPAEVLQLVLFHADTGALFTSLLSCKTIFDAAQAKHVVLQHLNRMPGLRLGLRDLDTKSLFDTFRRRAVKGLYGAGVSTMLFCLLTLRLDTPRFFFCSVSNLNPFRSPENVSSDANTRSTDTLHPRSWPT